MENSVIDIIKKYAFKKVTVTLYSEFDADLHIDSLQMMQIICDIEQKLEVKIMYSKLKNITTVNDLIKCIQEES